VSGNGKHPQRNPLELQHAGQRYTTWIVDCDVHARLTGEPCTFQDLLTPTFWSRNTDRLKVGDQLRVVRENEFDCELSVRWVGPGGVGVAVCGAIVGTKFYNQLKAAEAAAHAEAAAELAASVAPSMEGNTAP
jgi:hypothetical protein